MPSSLLQQVPNHNPPTKWKKIYDPPLLLPVHTSREVSETEEKKWFSQYSKTGLCKAPQEWTQLCADWHKSSQANRNIWLGEVQAKLWQSGRLTHPMAKPAFPAQFSSSIFHYHVPPEDSVLMEQNTNISRKNRYQKSRVTSPGTSFLQEPPPSLPLLLSMVSWLRCQLDKTPHSSNFMANFSASQGWDGEVGSSTYNRFIE